MNTPIIPWASSPGPSTSFSVYYCRVSCLVDVRTFPRSRKFPHFNGDKLADTLIADGIEYLYLGKELLGGFRRGGYATFMGTLGFSAAFSRLEQVGAGENGGRSLL